MRCRLLLFYVDTIGLSGCPAAKSRSAIARQYQQLAPARAFLAVRKALKDTDSYFSERYNGSMNTLSIRRPRPSIMNADAGLAQRVSEGETVDQVAQIDFEDVGFRNDELI